MDDELSNKLNHYLAMLEQWESALQAVSEPPELLQQVLLEVYQALEGLQFEPALSHTSDNTFSTSLSPQHTDLIRQIATQTQAIEALNLRLSENNTALADEMGTSSIATYSAKQFI